jgi:hypothetical protein
VADHTDHALWLGEKLGVNVDALRSWFIDRYSSQVLERSNNSAFVLLFNEFANFWILQ